MPIMCAAQPHEVNEIAAFNHVSFHILRSRGSGIVLSTASAIASVARRMSRYYDEDDELDIRIRQLERDWQPQRDLPSASGRSQPSTNPRPVIFSVPGRRQPDHRSFPRRPPIHPPRRIRRASTLPVRFEDDPVFIARPGHHDPSPPPRHHESPRDVVVMARPRQGRRASVDTLTSSDSEAEERKVAGETLGDVGTEREPLVRKDDIDVATPRVEILRSRSRSPVREREGIAGETSDGETGEDDLPKEGTTRIPTRLVTRKALVNMGYPYVQEVSREKSVCSMVSRV